MVRLVNDLLDVSRLARGKVQLERRRFEIRDAVDRAVDMANPLIVQRGHTLDVSVPASGLTVDADIARIVQVLSNLLTNAAKYTPPGGRIALTARASAGQVVLACEDNGPGIPVELVATLFDPFAQGPRTIDRSEGGLGLGLTLARAFAEMHGGTIAYERRDEGGSRFVVTLPLAAERRELRRRRSPPSPVRRGARSGFCWSTTISTPTRCCSRPRGGGARGGDRRERSRRARCGVEGRADRRRARHRASGHGRLRAGPASAGDLPRTSG